MFDVARNKVGLYNDVKSITSRVKLLMLTEPTEMFRCPNFGVGLRKYMFSYNNDNTIALIRDKLVEQLRLWEPAVIPEETKVTRGLTYSRDTTVTEDSNALNKLELTVTLTTTYLQVISFGIDENDLT